MSEREIAHWENDVSNLMGDATFRARAQEGLYRYLLMEGLTPEQAYPVPADSAKRTAYADWLSRRQEADGASQPARSSNHSS